MDKLLVAIGYIVIVFIIVSIISLIITINSAIKLEKRIRNYTIKDKSSTFDLSLIDYVINRYNKLVISQRKRMNDLFPTLSKRYDKYVTDGRITAVDFVTHKTVISLLFTSLTIISLLIRGSEIEAFQIIFSIIFGFYILDIFLIINNKLNKKKIENELFQAVIIMNNAFKSGKSTIQAVEIASKKLPKPINLEFKRIYQELKYGLSVDVAFDRFSKRVNFEEARYLSSSLTILSHTGGNIIAVFDSIEKTMFDKKKLKDDLKNSTAVSNLVTKVLLFIPIFVIAAIYILNPEYFNPFFESTLGYMLMTVCLITFIIYAILLNKIVKVEY